MPLKNLASATWERFRSGGEWNHSRAVTRGVSPLIEFQYLRGTQAPVRDQMAHRLRSAYRLQSTVPRPLSGRSHGPSLSNSYWDHRYGRRTYDRFITGVLAAGGRSGIVALTVFAEPDGFRTRCGWRRPKASSRPKVSTYSPPVPVRDHRLPDVQDRRRRHHILAATCLRCNIGSAAAPISVIAPLERDAKGYIGVSTQRDLLGEGSRSARLSPRGSARPDHGSSRNIWTRTASTKGRSRSETSIRR